MHRHPHINWTIKIARFFHLFARFALHTIIHWHASQIGIGRPTADGYYIILHCMHLILTRREQHKLRFFVRSWSKNEKWKEQKLQRNSHFTLKQTDSGAYFFITHVLHIPMFSSRIDARNKCQLALPRKRNQIKRRECLHIGTIKIHLHTHNKI